eukprot:scaffold23383_cov73-Isochrysis_galbana.AAC.1
MPAVLSRYCTGSGTYAASRVAASTERSTKKSATSRCRPSDAARSASASRHARLCPALRRDRSLAKPSASTCASAWGANKDHASGDTTHSRVLARRSASRSWRIGAPIRAKPSLRSALRARGRSGRSEPVVPGMLSPPPPAATAPSWGEVAAGGEAGSPVT